jgi:hypothetical protein
VGQSHSSHALEWLWRDLADVSHPRVLDCGPVSPITVDVLLRRRAKVHVGDLITPLLREEARFWERQGKTSVFRSQELLDQFPSISPQSVSAILGWHVLDLLPREAHQSLLDRWLSYLHPGGLLFFLLREPRLEKGSEITWWLEDLKVLGSDPAGRGAFSHPPLTNREVERLAPSGSVKIFLTRSGWREVLASKQE